MKDYLDEYIIATRLIHRDCGATIEELSEALDKTPRAVFSILNQLDSMMFPIYDMPDPDNPKKKRYHADRAFAEYLPSLDFSEEEKAVFNYLINASDSVPGIEIGARRLFTKFKLMAAERGALIENGNRKPVLIVSTKTLNKNIDNKKLNTVTSDLLSAIKEKKWVTLEYRNAVSNGFFSYTVFPLLIFIHKGDSYAYVRNRFNGLRVIALERIGRIESTFDGDIPPDDTDVIKLLDDPFGFICDMDETEVILEVDSEQASFEKAINWPISTKLEEKEDGALLMKTRTHSYFDLKRWILERTPHIRVMSPEWMREDIKETLSAGLELNSSQEIEKAERS